VWSRLLAAAHLVVAFGADGALWFERHANTGQRARLVFDAGRAEGEWAGACAGRMVGLHATFTAAVVHHLARLPAGAKPDLMPGIRAGLEATRDLHRLGHGGSRGKAGTGGTSPAGFPARRLARVIAAGQADLPKALTADFAAAEIPWPAPGEPVQPAASRRWTILEAAHRLPPPPDGQPVVHPEPLLGLGMEVARRGTVALNGLPKARFGDYLTADRSEMEALRSLERLMRNQAADPKPARPLNLAVFGPPGAGKSFAVRELAREVFGKEAWLEFNLAQFGGPEELYDAFHRIRDLALAGRTPVAFWDEFDSQDLRWLRYLLAPMQDAAFNVGQLVHAIGKCVFVFAGGTSPRFRDFAARGSSDSFRAAKGPDFVSRLDGHLDVLGPNRRLRAVERVVGGETVEVEENDPDDIGMPLRRALMLRGQLRLEAERLAADDGILRALLAVPAWRHGSRSFTKLVATLHQSGALRRDALPPAMQLDMLVDAEAFGRLLAPRLEGLDDVAFVAKVETLASAIHGMYQDHMQRSGAVPAARFAAAFNALDEEAKEDNRAAARRMPGVLALAGLALCESNPLHDDVVRAHLERQIERLAEAEHDGWVEHRRLHGWTLGERSDKNRRHPSLKPFRELDFQEQEKDRNTVRHYPDFAWAAGLRIGLLR
jgi:DNA polymerase III delta prime subunit